MYCAGDNWPFHRTEQKLQQVPNMSHEGKTNFG